MKGLLTCLALFPLLTNFLAGQTVSNGIYEPFAYSDNTLINGQGGWSLLSGTLGPSNVAGNLTLPSGMPTPSGDRLQWGGMNFGSVARLQFNTVSNGAVYFSFAFSVSSVGTSGNTSDAIAGLGLGSSVSTAPRICFLSNSPSAYRLGLANGVGPPLSGAIAPTVFSTGDTLFVVGRYTFNPVATNDTCDMWLNPDALTLGGGVAPAPTIGGVKANGGAALSAVGEFFVRNAGTEVVSIDELRIGDTWASVTPVPEPAIISHGMLIGAVCLAFHGKRGRPS